jgi:hypothetical protein
MTCIEECTWPHDVCRLCSGLNKLSVNIFETVIFRDGCILAEKLNELYGIEVSGLWSVIITPRLKWMTES